MARGLSSPRCGAKNSASLWTLSTLHSGSVLRPWLESCSGSTAICMASRPACRTLGVLCLGSALAVLSIHAVTGSDASRVIQGIVTGVGFLGAGVIVRSEKGHHVQGLTTAACVWVTACMGAACAIAQWQIVVIGVVLVFGILVLGGPFEKAIDRRWPWRPTEVAHQPPDTTRLPSAEVIKESDSSTHR